LRLLASLCHCPQKALKGLPFCLMAVALV
jgi:hypothetical protein